MKPELNVSDDAAGEAKASKPNGRWRDARAETVDQLRRSVGADERRDGGEHVAPWGRHADGTPITDEFVQAIIDDPLGQKAGLRWPSGADKFQSEDEIWAATHYGGGGPRGSHGLDHAILIATSFLYLHKPLMTDAQIVDRVMERVRGIKNRDAPNERWNWATERREIADKLQRFKPWIAQKRAAETGTISSSLSSPSMSSSSGTAANTRDRPDDTDKLTALEYAATVAEGPGGWTEDRQRTLIQKMDESHAVVLVGSKARYLHRGASRDGQSELSFLTQQDMRILYEAVRIPFEKTTTTKKGTITSTEHLPAFDKWRLLPERKQYTGIGFYPPPRIAPPGHLNLWTDLAIKPKAGNWGLFRDHLHLVVCSGNEEWFLWLLDYMAHAVQRPGEKPGSAVVLFSPEEGTGKTIVNEMMKRIFGQHAVGVSKSEQFLGRFNAVVGSKIWLATEEAFWAGSKQLLGAYKNLITEPRAVIEPKGIDPFEIDNFTRIFATTNEKWNTPAGVNGRRFFVLEVKNDRARDPAYFNPIWKQMLEEGGLEAMLHHLLKREIKSDLRNPPETPALKVQRQRTLDGVQQWLWVVASDGEIRDHGGGDTIILKETAPTTIPSSTLLRAAEVALPRMKPGEIRTDLGELLPKLGVIKGQETTGRRQRTYTITSLHSFQDAVERELKVAIQN